MHHEMHASTILAPRLSPWVTFCSGRRTFLKNVENSKVTLSLSSEKQKYFFQKRFIYFVEKKYQMALMKIDFQAEEKWAKGHLQKSFERSIRTRKIGNVAYCPMI